MYDLKKISKMKKITNSMVQFTAQHARAHARDFFCSCHFYGSIYYTRRKVVPVGTSKACKKYTSRTTRNEIIKDVVRRMKMNMIFFDDKVLFSGRLIYEATNVLKVVKHRPVFIPELITSKQITG